MTSSTKKGPATNPPISAGSETAKQLSLSRKKVIVMLAPGVLLLGIGIYGVQGGFITTGKTTPTDSTTTTAIDLSPPQAKPHGLKNDVKYDNTFSTSDLKPSATKPLPDKQAQASTEALTGQSARIGLGSNEHLTESDLARVNQTGGPAFGSTTAPSKSTVNRQYLNENDRARREQERVMRTMYRAPKSREQLAEDRQTQEERAYNRQATERLLRQIEGTSRTGATGPAETDSKPLYMAEYRRLKQANGGQLPAQYADLFKREIAAEQTGQTEPRSSSSTKANTMILPDGYDAPPTASNRNAFYGTGGRTLRATNMPNSHNMAIPAVIHGDADIVTVSSGSTVKIRLLEATQLLLNGEIVTLPANSLVSGVCHIADERIMLTVNTLRQGNYLYETDLVAYDLDGRAGLRVPNLNEKNRVAQALGQTAQSSAMSPYYLIPQGGVGQQVGAQVAVQAGTTLFQGARALIQGKLSAPKASIKPNYRIYLKSGGRSGAGKALADF